MPYALRPDDTGGLVSQLQGLLSELHLLGPDDIDGVFGEATEAAVRELQSSNGLVVDGIVGPLTWEALFARIEELGTLGPPPYIFLAEPPTEPPDIPPPPPAPTYLPGAPPSPGYGPPPGSPSPGRARPAPPLPEHASPMYDPEPESAPQPSPSSPVPAAGSHDEMVERAFSDLVHPGRLFFDPPATMRLGETRRVDIRLARSLEMDEELVKDAAAGGVPHLETIPVAPIMAVSLKGDAFRITPLSDEEQTVLRDSVTSWEFDICSLKRGSQQLVLSVSLRIPVEGHPLERRSEPVREATIDVQVTVPARVGHFVSSNWQWLATALLGLAGTIAAWEKLVH